MKMKRELLHYFFVMIQSVESSAEISLLTSTVRRTPGLRTKAFLGAHVRGVWPWFQQ